MRLSERSSGAELTVAVAQALSRVPTVRVAYLFGSRAKGTARPGSDLDVGVLYDRALDASGREEARRDVLDALAEDLGALGERADIVDLERCDSSVAFQAIRDGKLAVARSEAERVRAVVAVARRYDDDAPKRELFRSAARRLARGAHG